MALVASLDRYESLESALQAYGVERSAQVSPFQEQARLSGQWFADVCRYIDLEPNQFTTMLHARRSTLLPHLPPRVYYVIRQIRRKAVPVVKAIYR